MARQKDKAGNRVSKDIEALERLLEEGDRRDGSPEERLEDLSRCFLDAVERFKRRLFPKQVSLAVLVVVFRKAAQKRGLDPEQFYLTVLERMVGAMGAEEVLPALPKVSTKERILAAALEVFSEKGFHLATMDEIADRAGVGKGTLYRYFRHKETLFNELVRLRLEELERNAMAVLDGQDDVLTMITKYIRTYFEFFDRNQRLYRLIVQERLDVGEQVQDLYVKKVMRRIPLLKRKIYGASQQGVLKDIDFQTVFYGVMGFIHGVIQKWLARDCSYSLVEELPGVVEVLFYGFVNTDFERVKTQSGEEHGQERSTG